MSAEFDTWVERARAVPIESEIVRRGVALRRSGSERIGPCPRCGGDDRFSINVKDNVWNCRQCKPDNISGDIIGLVEWLDNCEFVRACETLNQEPPPVNGHTPHDGTRPREVAWYDYLDEAGVLLFQVVRFDPKDFRQRKPGINGGWDWSTKDVRQVPYHLPELTEAIALERRVFIVEGEKDVLTLERLGMTATCNAMGAGKWRSQLNQYFRGADVVIIADHDPPSVNKKTGEKLFHSDGRARFAGFDHAMQVAAELKPIAANVRLFDVAALWHECPEKGDITDYFEHGGTVDELNDFVARLEGWSPKIETPAAISVPVVLPFPLDESAIPVRDWVIPGLLMRRHITVLVAPSGSGKSLLTLQVGISCAQGRRWSGWLPRQKFRVMFINSEDDTDEMRRRLAAAARVMEVDQVALRHGIALVDNTSSGAVVAKFDARTKTLTRTPLADQIVEAILNNGVDIVFVDPFAETFEGDENSNSELKWAGVLWRDVARRTNTAMCLVHHTKKYATGMAGDVDAARGAGALIGIARIVSTLFPMSAREAEAMGVADDKRGLYLRYDDAKANLNIKSPQARWFFKQTITLDNKTAELPGDDVGVLIPWTPIGPNVLESQIIAFFKRIDAGLLDQDGKATGEFYSFDYGRRAVKNSVTDFAQEFFEIEARASAEKLIEGWKRDHRLEQVQYRSPHARRVRPRVISELDPVAPKNRKALLDPQPEQQEAFDYELSVNPR